MQVKETTKEDLLYMANNSVSRGIQKYCPEQIEFVYTLEHEGKPLAIGGLRLINLTTAWCWVDLTHEAGKYLIPVYRNMKEVIDNFIKEHNIKRLQAYIESDFPEAVRMVQHLGFNKESIMTNFIGNKDAYMYVRII